DRVRAHVCLCMLAYYVEWHMRQKLAPMLFDDADKEAAAAERTSIVTAITPNHPLTVLTRATPIQRKAFALPAIAV
ncbi:MAG: hypothetical protein ACREE5_01670, partial [Acetobacteraceae bacterium]